MAIVFLNDARYSLGREEKRREGERKGDRERGREIGREEGEREEEREGGREIGREEGERRERGRKRGRKRRRSNSVLFATRHRLTTPAPVSSWCIPLSSYSPHLQYKHISSIYSRVVEKTTIFVLKSKHNLQTVPISCVYLPSLSFASLCLGSSKSGLEGEGGIWGESEEPSKTLQVWSL